MLRITSKATAEGVERVRLDGRLTQTSLPELNDALGPSLRDPARLALDVSGLTFVDVEGARLLKELLNRKVQIHGCSSFVAHLLGLS